MTNKAACCVTYSGYLSHPFQKNFVVENVANKGWTLLASLYSMLLR